jgi:hypothetical protein
VEDGNLSLSYPELLAEASHLAHTLGDVVFEFGAFFECSYIIFSIAIGDEVIIV